MRKPAYALVAALLIATMGVACGGGGSAVMYALSW